MKTKIFEDFDQTYFENEDEYIVDKQGCRVDLNTEWNIRNILRQQGYPKEIAFGVVKVHPNVFRCNV